MNWLTDVSVWMRNHMASLSLAIVASSLAVSGGAISRTVRNSIKSCPFLVRAGVFVLLVTFGYGALTVLVASLLARGLACLDDRWLAPVVAIAFIVIALIAEEKKQI